MNIIEHKFKNSNSGAFTIVGYLFFALGLIILLFGNVFFGFIVTIGAGFACFTKQGTQIDTLENKVRSYNSYYGIKTGKWQYLTLYPYVGILSSNKGLRMHSMAGNITDSSNLSYDICLLNKTHRQRIIIQKSEDKIDAMEIAKKLAEKLALEVVLFNPVISEKTRNRR